jgi:M6 family metalloprotease-like protein
MKKISLLVFVLFITITAYSAYLKNVPVDLKQPDGTVIHCFITGDEFHRRVHNKDNYTIIQEPQTGYYVYALKKGEELVPSEYVVGKSDPKKLAIEPNLDIPVQRMEEKRTEMLKSTKISTGSQNIGKFYNLVVFVRFADDEEFADKFSTYKSMFNNKEPGTNSVYNYFLEASYGQIEVSSSLYPTSTNDNILSYKDFNPRNFYTAWSLVNPIGYKSSLERSEREQLLLQNAINSIKSEISPSSSIDGNNDNIIDNICFIIKGSPELWGELLWPHASYLRSRNIVINQKAAATYSFQLEFLEGSGVGILCHELFHNLGAPDLYRYNDNGIQPVAFWDIMEETTNPPQHMGAYMKFRYGGWISSIPEISKNGTYYLNPVTASKNNCYRINSPNSSDEYFVLEYRKKHGTFENSLPNEGLLIYRINSKSYWGNSFGPPDEVYLFRSQGTLTNNGNPELAAFSSNEGRTYINDNSDPNGFLSDGIPGGIDISNIGTIGDSISFTFKKCNPYKLALTSPNGGENFKINSKTIITWINSGTETVKIEFSDDGLKWQLIDSLINQSVKDTNSFLWTIPGITTQSAKIRISDAEDKTIYSESKNFFTISNTGQVFEKEPNNSAVQATTIEVGDIFEGEISNPEDADYYKFNASVGDTIDIFANAKNSNLQGLIRLFSSDGTSQWYGSGMNENSFLKQRLSIIIPKTGKYYIRYDHRADWGIFPNSIDPNRAKELANAVIDSLSNYIPDNIGKYLISLKKFKPTLPDFETSQVWDLKLNSGILSSSIKTNGSKTCVTFDYGVTNSYGNSVDADNNCFQIFNQSWYFQAPIKGLMPNTTYHYKITAKNDNGVISTPDLTFKTAQESEKWELQIPIIYHQIPTIKEHFRNYIPLNKDTGFVVSSTCLYKTTDGGNSWEKQFDVSTFDLNNYQLFQHGTFIDENNGWIVGTNIYRTTDGGKSWKKQSKPTDKYLWSVSFFDVNYGVAVGSNGVILNTVDGGKTWKVSNNGNVNLQFYRLWAVQLVDKNIGYAVGDNGTSLKTTDGGNTWIKLETGSIVMFNNLYFTDYLTGHIVGSGGNGPGVILRTTDGGITWQIQNNPTGEFLYGVHFIDKNNGIVCGTDGAIALTSDGGNVWRKQESGVRSVLHDIKYIDSTNAVIVGDWEIVLKSKNLTTKEIVLVSPIGAEVWDAGSVHEIIWQKNNVSHINILYSTDLLNAHWDTIATNVLAAVNSYKWLIPNITSNKCKIRIVDAENKTVISENMIPFTIKELYLTSDHIEEVNKQTGFCKIYPNPTSGIVNIEFLGGTDHKIEISVSSLVGAEIFRKKIVDLAKFQIDLSNQVSGVYFLKINYNGQQSISKIMVRKE